MPEAGLDAWRGRIDAALVQALDLPDAPPRLREAMRHAVLLGGKRMRPLLTMATGVLFDAPWQALIAAGVSVELIHAYSLVHDDLPSMDDDALRRGQPTVHVAFDEATAVLAGDALQSLAFDVLARAAVPSDIGLALVRTLAQAAGVLGMCGGQALDLDATGHSALVDLPALERVHALKTGALIRAAVRMGALCGAADETDLARLDDFACALGLAFQVRDDILDVEGDTSQLGKTAGKDLQQDKATFPAIMGIDASRAKLATLQAAMSQALAGFDDRAAPLRALAAYAVDRTY